MKDKRFRNHIDLGIQYRSATIRATDEGDEDEGRTAELSFSSEEPVSRYWGNEILDHDAESVRLDRMRVAGPLLVDHDPRDVVGVVEEIRIDNDRMGRALVRFGESVRANEILADVRGGIRKSVSVGYRIHELLLESKDDEQETYRATDWEPFEISLVSIPADVSVGVGRSESVQTRSVPIFEQGNIMSEETRNDPVQPEVVERIVPDPKAAEDALQAERERISIFMAIADKHDLHDEARHAINAGTTVEDFRANVLDILAKRQPESKPVAFQTEIGLGAAEVGRYSLMNAIRASVNRDWKHAGFERECSLAIADKLGRDPQGFFLPMEVVAMRTAHLRAMNNQFRAPPMDTTENTHLVGTDHMANMFIEALRPNTIVMQLGALPMTGLVGNVDIPKQTGVAAFYWLAEGADVTDSEVPTGTVALTPKTVAGSVPMTRRLLKQSAPSAEAIVLNDLIVGAGEAIDLAALEGGGAEEPEGIGSTTGVLTQAITTPGQPTWPEIVGFETTRNGANADRGANAYVTSSSVIGSLKTTAKDAGSGIFLFEGGETNGYPCRSRNGIPANRIYFGSWNQIIIGFWGVLDVMPDPAALAASGGLVLRVFQDVDVALRHPESFCIDTV